MTNYGKLYYIKGNEYGEEIEQLTLNIPGAPGVTETLQRWGWNMKNLINTTPEDWMKIRHAGEKTLQKIKDYIHELGYTTLFERSDIIDHCLELQSQGVNLLDTYNLSIRVLLILHYNGVYTIRDVLETGTNIYGFNGLNDVDKKEILEKLGFIIGIAETNNILMKRIKEKEQKLSDLSILIAEQKSLLAREAELDKMIESMNLDSEEKHATR